MKKSLLVTSFGIAVSAFGQSQQERPNVILLVADDLGYGDLSCYGAKGVCTPCVDSIANEGILFTDAHACASTSTPSRYSLLTGEYPFRKAGTDVAQGNAGMIISPSQFTVADAFKQAGYTTGAIGKWHLGLGSRGGQQDWNGRLDQDLSDIGFDYHYIMAATADRVPCVFIENGSVANRDPSAPIFCNYKSNYPGEPTGKDNPELLTKLKPSHGHNQSIVNGISRIGFMKGGGKALWKDENIADSIASKAIQFMERNKEQPFFLYLCTNDVHVPRYPHERFRGKSPMGLRGEAILQFDWTVKQVTDAMKRLGITDNTLLIITSDNGPVLNDGYQDHAEELVGEHRPGGPFRGGKYSCFEAGSVIPFIVSWPAKIKQGKKSNALISLVDNVATMADLVATSVPEGGAKDSRSALKTWLGDSEESRPFAIKSGANHTLSIRAGKWKYIEPGKGGPMISWGPKIESGCSPTPQLYDMTYKAWEDVNVSALYPQKMKQMQELLYTVRSGIYPVSFDKKQRNLHESYRLRKVRTKIEGKNEQYLYLPAPNKVYNNLCPSALSAQRGDSVRVTFDYYGQGMNGYVYLDFGNDGIFNSTLNADCSIPQGSDILSFSYYGSPNANHGKNSKGEVLSSNRNQLLDPPVFVLPDTMEYGYYRMRLKVDHNEIDAMGKTGTDNIATTGGAIVDLLINVHGTQSSVSTAGAHGDILLSDGTLLSEGHFPFGTPLSIRLKANDGYEVSGLEIKSGYHFDQDSLICENQQWQVTSIGRDEMSDDCSYTIPARLMDGEVRITGKFVREGSGIAPEEPTRYQTTSIYQGNFLWPITWYTLQIDREGYVLAHPSNDDFFTLDTTQPQIENEAHLWCFTGNEKKGYRIYNKKTGTAEVLMAPIEMTGKNGGSSYPMMGAAGQIPPGYTDVWRFMDADALGTTGAEYAYLYEDGYPANKVNRRGDRLAFWTTGQNHSSTLYIKKAKVEEEPVGIAGTTMSSSSPTYYDLSGRKVRLPQKGIYIVNGKKVFVE